MASPVCSGKGTSDAILSHWVEFILTFGKPIKKLRGKETVSNNSEHWEAQDHPSVSLRAYKAPDFCLFWQTFGMKSQGQSIFMCMCLVFVLYFFPNM